MPAATRPWASSLLSSFGFPDALHGEITVWHSARTALDSVAALAASVMDDPRGFFQVDELLEDLWGMESAFGFAQEKGIKVAFVWEFGTGGNTMMWRIRGGYPNALDYDS